MPKITQYPAKTVPSNNDEFVFHEPASGSTKKMTRGDLIGGAPLPANSVTTAALANNSVTTAAIADSSVTADKIDFATFGIKAGVISGSTLSSTGVKTITTGFRPRIVKFTLLTADSITAFRQSTGAMTSDTQFTNTIVATSNNVNGTSSTSRAMIVLNVVGSGSLITYLEFSRSGFTDTGFSINVNKTSGNLFSVAYEAYA